MTAPADIDAAERFRELVAGRLGLQFEATKLGFLEDVLRRRLAARGESVQRYLAHWSMAEIGALAEQLTVTETYFFRHHAQFDALRDVVWPDLRGGRRPVRMLSAGCASGEEAYSIAILAREAGVEAAVRAVDVNPAMLRKAGRACFSEWALRETPADVRRRWFRPAGRDLLLDDAVRAGVAFERRNLIDDDAELWPAGGYDVVFCRNVIMYFPQPVAQAVIARITRALAPGGYLFLGHAETLRNLSQDFRLCHAGDAFYYRREGEAAAVDAMAAWPRVAERPAECPPECPPNWADVIGRASERIEALMQQPGAADPLLAERFAGALAGVQARPVPGAERHGADLRHAVLLAHDGQLAEAEASCRRLLETDALSAGAHYVLALCREAAQDHAAAAAHGRLAAYLDPGFAMPRLQLGLLARRTGAREAARRELGQALILLRQEDDARLLLFGGGFARGALLALCESALRDCGGRP